MNEANNIKENNNVNDNINNNNKLEIPNKELKSPDYALNITSAQDFSDSERNIIDSKRKLKIKEDSCCCILCCAYCSKYCCCPFCCNSCCKFCGENCLNCYNTSLEFYKIYFIFCQCSVEDVKCKCNKCNYEQSEKGCACFWKLIEKIIAFTLALCFFSMISILAEIFIIIYILIFGWGLLLYNKDRDKDCRCAPHYYVLYCWNWECEILGKILAI